MLSIKYAALMICLSITVVAETNYPCAVINLRDSGKPMEHVEIQQQSFGTCYAYSSAMAMDAYRISRSDYKDYRIDPNYLALINAIHFSEDDEPLMVKSMEGGSPVKMLRYFLENNRRLLFTDVDPNGERPKICLRHKDDPKLKLLQNFQTIEELTQLIIVKRKLQKVQAVAISNPKQMVSESTSVFSAHNFNIKSEEITVEDKLKQVVNELLNQYESIYQTSEKLAENNFMCMMEDLVPNINDQSFFLQSGPLDVLRAHLEKGCLWELMPDPVRIDYYGDHPYEAKFSAKVLYDNLTINNAQPVVISYCNTAFDLNRLSPGPDSDDTCGPHTSLVIGSRIQGNRCEYLLRNNYSCKMLLKDYGIHKGECSADGQDTWVDGDRLLKQIFSLDIIVAK